LIAAGFGTLKLLHKDMGTVVTHWVHALRVDPDNQYIHALMEKAFAISPKQLKELSFGTFFYAFLRFLEGIGLVLRKRWGEYLTIAVTALFIPLEIWEMVRHFTALKAGVFLVNVAIVAYLAIGLRRSAGTEAAESSAVTEKSGD
jgi:uncharacterized membrane protein (DUF2068 family)